MMKKRIVALLLAGLMTTAALASCRVQTNNNNNPGGTEPNQGTSQTTPKPDDPSTPATPTWTDADKTVYTVSDVKLRKEASDTSEALATIAKATAVHCTKQSSTWYCVEYGDKQGYIRKTTVTDENISGSDMVEVAGGSKTMYVGTDGLQKRLYPSSNNNISTVLGSHKLNDVVTVTHTNDNWSRIQAEDGSVYYLANRYLSNSVVIDPNDDSVYEDLFSDVAGTPMMYVSGVDSVHFRKAPNTNSTDVLTLRKGDSVKVLKTGVVDGKNWTYALVEVPPKKEGDGITYEYGYISSNCLAYTNGEMSIEDLLAIYTTFTQTEATMYVLQEKTITIRSAPIFPDEGEDNTLSHPQSGTTPETVKMIKVLATGEVDGTQWFIVEYTKKDGENDVTIRGFVGGKAIDLLTSDPSGKSTVTLKDLLLKYPDQFEILETPNTITLKGLSNCYGTPAVATTPLKQLAANTTVTVVAVGKGTPSTWSVIQDSEGAYYFIQSSLLN